MSTFTVRPLNYSPVDRVLDQFFFLLSQSGRCINLYTFFRKHLHTIEVDVPIEELTELVRILSVRTLSPEEEEVVCTYLIEKYIHT